MLETKISEITQVTDCQKTDLLIISRPDGLGGYDSYAMIGKAIDSFVKPYTKLVALLTQTGTNDPTAVECENDLDTFTYKRTALGVYEIVSPSNAYVLSGTFVIVNTGDKLGYVRAYQHTIDKIRIETFDTSFVQSDGILDHTSIEIRVY